MGKKKNRQKAAQQVAEPAVEEQKATETEPEPTEETTGRKWVTYDQLRRETWGRVEAACTLTMVDAVIRGLTDLMTGHLASGEVVRLPGLGTFSLTDHKERAGVNPRTGEKIVIPARKAVHFSAAKALKESVNG